MTNSFENQIFNESPMKRWLDDAVEVLALEGLPFSSEAIIMMRKYIIKLEIDKESIYVWNNEGGAIE